MASFKDIWNQLFGKEPPKPSNQPVVHEVIERSENEQQDYEAWKDSDRQTKQLEFVHQEYHKVQEEKNLLGSTFYYLDEPSSKGFILNFRPDLFAPEDFRHYFDYLKERVQEFDYAVYTSDVRSFARANHAEEIQRHHLKPRSRRRDDQMEQQFGNITITLVRHDDKPVYIKFICHSYRDRNYTEAADYRKLIERVIH